MSLFVHRKPALLHSVMPDLPTSRPGVQDPSARSIYCGGLDVHFADEWGSAQELFSAQELQEKFSLERITKSAAVFDKTKLSWMNGQYLRALPDDEVRPSRDLLVPLFTSARCLATEYIQYKHGAPPEPHAYTVETVFSICAAWRQPLTESCSAALFRFTHQVQHLQQTERGLIKTLTSTRPCM